MTRAGLLVAVVVATETIPAPFVSSVASAPSVSTGIPSSPSTAPFGGAPAPFPLSQPGASFSPGSGATFGPPPGLFPGAPQVSTAPLPGQSPVTQPPGQIPLTPPGLPQGGQ